MKYLTLLLLVGFVGVAVFGLAVSDHGMTSMNETCIASTVDGVMCPTNVFAFVSHHISAFKAFSSVLLSSLSGLLALLASLLLAAAAAFISRKDVLRTKPAFPRQRLHALFSRSRHSQRLRIRWFSLLVNSPSF